MHQPYFVCKTSGTGSLHAVGLGTASARRRPQVVKPAGSANTREVDTAHARFFFQRVAMTEVASVAQFEAQVAGAGAGLVVVNFWADWAAACQQMSAVAVALRAKYPQVTFLNVEAEKVFELSEAHAVESVPTFVLLTAGKEVGRVTGADVPGLTSKVEALAGAPAGTGGAAAAAAAPAEDLDAKLKRLVAQHDVMLFMKGDPDEPRCGFSRKASGLLKDAGVEFGSFDILSDEEVRQGLKTFSNWPTYPQLYGQGKLVGGLDIMQELAEAGELVDSLQA